MKPEVYSCLRMLDTFTKRLVNLHNIGANEAVISLQKQYFNLCNVLKENLSGNEYKMVQKIKISNLSNIYSGSLGKIKRELMEELIVSASLTATYLHSLEMSLDKELIKKRIELSKKEEGLKIQQKEIESYKKLLKNSFEAIKQFPELQRSRTVEEIKKSHRGIEKNTNKKTKSQIKNETNTNTRKLE